MFAKILAQPVSRYASGDTAKFISAFSNDLNAIEQNYLIGELNLFAEILNYLATAVVLLVLNLPLGLVLIVSSLLAILVSYRFGGRVVRNETESMAKASDFVAQTQDLLNGFPVIKSFRAEQQIMTVFSRKNVELESTKQQRRASNDTVSIVGNISAILVTTVFLSVGFLMAFNGLISVGRIIGFYELSGNMLSPIRSLGVLAANRRAAGALIERIGREITDAPAPAARLQNVPAPPRTITLRDLSFGYGQEAPVLRGISHTFEAGKRYALVGGSGKSTLLKLLMGFLPGYSGQVLYDGAELRGLDLDQLTEHLSVIQQEVFCFNSTLFRPFPPAELERAIRQAGLAGLCQAKGRDFLCGEGGCNLSGGERQRVSIARCLIRNAPIILADEAEAALDNKTAAAVLQTILGLDSALRILVTHRLDAAILREDAEVGAAAQGFGVPGDCAAGGGFLRRTLQISVGQQVHHQGPAALQGKDLHRAGGDLLSLRRCVWGRLRIGGGAGRQQNQRQKPPGYTAKFHENPSLSGPWTQGSFGGRASCAPLRSVV